MSDKVQNPVPTFQGSPFICPHCRQFAKQRWGQAGNTFLRSGNTVWQSFDVSSDDIFFSRCDACDLMMIWKNEVSVWPATSLAPEPHTDFPYDLWNTYNEARQVYNASPRASAALLRLCLQSLCIHLGAPGKNINSDIQHLYDEFGLGRRVRDSMDILRVVGNNAVHPGEINLEDSQEISLGLFRIIKYIIDKAISEPAHVDSIYAQLPNGAREAIERRGLKSGPDGRAPLELPSDQKL